VAAVREAVQHRAGRQRPVQLEHEPSPGLGGDGEDKGTVGKTAGRDLRPAGSWMTPFRGATRQMNRSYLIWFAIWIGGILVVNLYSLLRSYSLVR